MPAGSNKNPRGDTSKLVKLGSNDQDVLTVLSGRGEVYGLEILDQLNLDRPGGPMRFGSLYPVLNRLEKKKLVTWRWGDETEETGGARRKYYKITALGSRSLRAVQQYRAALALEGVK